jgi:hypothetical protein
MRNSRSSAGFRRSSATVAALVVAVVGGLVAAQVPSAPKNVVVSRSGRGVLQASDFTYVGAYDTDFDGLNTVWGNAFTHRYVGGELRFLTFALSGELVELAAPPALGGSLRVTNRWPKAFEGATWTIGSHFGIWWDEAAQRLWSTDAIDYPDDAHIMDTPNIATRTLNPDGTIRNLRRVSLEGIGARRIYGGCQATPASWRTQWGLLAYLCGWGGGASRIAQGLPASLGPTAYGLPDPASVANGTTFSPTQFKTYMEYPFQGSDWYSKGHPTVGDRGVRNTDVINYLDSGDPRQNPSTPPTGPPVAAAQWLSPAPDSLGRMVWGDTFLNTGMAIDGTQLYGLAMVGCFFGGKTYYMYSQTNNEKRLFELQIFDPAQFAEAAAGRRQPWEVKPISRGMLSLPGLGAPGNARAGCPVGASYDPITKRAYVYGTWIQPEVRNRVYVFDVAGQ